MAHPWRRYLAVGITGAALLLALAAGGAASVFDAPAASVPGNATVGAGQYRLSPPTEQDLEGIFVGSPAYASQPNESDPAGP